jgi:hypothetical protein
VGDLPLPFYDEAIIQHHFPTVSKYASPAYLAYLFYLLPLPSSENEKAAHEKL